MQKYLELMKPLAKNTEVGAMCSSLYVHDLILKNKSLQAVYTLCPRFDSVK